MSAGLKEIRLGLADALSVIEGLSVSAYIQGDPTPPFAQVVPDETEFHQAFDDGAESWGLIVQLVVAMGSDRGAQERLDRFLETEGPESVKAALEADETLGGIVSDVTVTSTDGYATYRFGSAQVEGLGSTWHVSVFV